MNELHTGRVIRLVWTITMMMMMTTLSSSIRIFFYCLHLLDWPHCVYVCVCVCMLCVLNTRPVKPLPPEILVLALPRPLHIPSTNRQPGWETDGSSERFSWLAGTNQKKKSFPACLWLVLLHTQTDQSAPRKKPSMSPPWLPWTPPVTVIYYANRSVCFWLTVVSFLCLFVSMATEPENV